MLNDAPSRTAWRVAIRRAAHQVLDHPRVFDDPLALPILGLGDNGRQLFLEDEKEQTRFARSMRAFMAVRSRVAEEELSAAVDRGVTQYVVLGAGLDTFACRSPFGDRLQVFELDHPATQAWKRDQLRSAGIREPAWLRFVPVDFEQQTAFDALVGAGLDLSRPAWFSWLGVTMYLESSTVWPVLRSIAALPAASGVVFDYAVPPEILGPRARAVFDDLAERVARAGEPWMTFFEPHALGTALLSAGFSSVRDRGRDEMNVAYFNDREDDLRVGGVVRLLTASV
jgi:methyltransferase (TIGR00027 family)